MNNYLDAPRKIQFELSSTCNLLCLGCVRTDPGTLSESKSFIDRKTYLSKETFLKIISASDLASVTHLEFCGTIDDPLMHPEFIQLLESALSVKQYTINIHTNASLRNTEFWQKLATVLAQHRSHQVNFSIDGLEDTNHIYRQNSNWNKIITNATSFIAAGGYAVWQHLIFPWNSHQTEQIKSLSINMGFKEFHQRRDRSIATQLGLDKIKLRQAQGRAAKSSNSTLDDINRELAEKNTDSIECNTRNQGMLFVSYEGKIWPCCFIQNGFLNLDQGRRKLLNDRLYSAYNSDTWNNANITAVSDILNHRFFKEDLVDSWDSVSCGGGAKDKIHRCSEVCAKKKLIELPIGKHTIDIN